MGGLTTTVRLIMTKVQRFCVGRVAAFCIAAALLLPACYGRGGSARPPQSNGIQSWEQQIQTGVTAEKVIQVLGPPSQVEFDNGTGPSEYDEAYGYLWTYLAYPGKKHERDTLVLIMASGEPPASNSEASLPRVGKLVRGFISPAENINRQN